MKKIILITLALIAFSCSKSNNDNNSCECYKNHYINNELESSQYYSNDCSDDNKVIVKVHPQIIKIECK